MRPAPQRAAALLRWYPPRWRARYGEEFAELLIADIAERPRSAARTADVVRGGIVARLAGAGLCGFSAHARTSLVSLTLCAAVFVGFAVSIWSQLIIGWQWSQASTAATTAATRLMSFAVLGLLVFGAAAVLPVAWSVVTGWTSRLARPAALVLVSVTVLFIGARHFGNGWPGTGGPHEGLVPAGLAAFCWAMTLSVSAYWAHPAALAHFPAAELAWMVISPLALAAAAGGAACCLSRADLSARALRAESYLAVAACGAMAVYLAGCCLWIFDRTQPGAPFRVGVIDVAGLAVMTFAFAAGQRAAMRCCRLTDPRRGAGSG